VTYLDLAGFKARSIMPAADIDLIESIEPGWIDTKLEDTSDEIDARLAKRYAVPFGAADLNSPRTDVPRIVLRWLTALVTADCYAKRGANPSSPYDQSAIIDPAALARLELKEAADSETGLFELPLLASDSANGVTRGGPLSYSEASPYTWTRRQRELAADED
jgi:hypothetical protein